MFEKWYQPYSHWAVRAQKRSGLTREYFTYQWMNYFPLFPCLYCVIPPLAVYQRLPLSPSRPLSLLSLRRLQTSNPGSGVRPFDIPTLFIVSSLKTLTVFLPFTTLWLSAHFLSTCRWFGFWDSYHSFGICTNPKQSPAVVHLFVQSQVHAA